MHARQKLGKHITIIIQSSENSETDSMLTITYRPIALTLLIFASTVSADTVIYTWLDENGKSVYGQTPANGVNATVFRVVTQKVDSAAAQEKLQQDAEEFEERRKARETDEETQDIAEQNEDITRKNCEIAKKNLELLQARGQVSLKEGDEYRVLPEEERQEKIAEANKGIEEYCNKGS